MLTVAHFSPVWCRYLAWMDFVVSGQAKLKHGQRVINQHGEVGHIEPDELCDDDPLFKDCSYVRWLTPNNEPSIMSSTCHTKDLTAVPDSVVPMQRNAAWWAESRALCDQVTAAFLS